MSVTNTLIGYEITYPTQIWLKDLTLPEGSKAFKIRRLKKIGEEVLGLETRIFPLEVAERFALEDLKSEPFIVLLRRNADTEVHRVVYRTRSSQLLEMEAEMMGIPEGSPALVRAGVHYNRTDQPMMTGRVTFPAEKVELHFEVRKDQRIQERLTLK
ncbi:MAG: UTRA domain-containing protein [Deltaproteobacteria bacterium]|nr:UTRA domain-containing protein [Deltaproteobacteria bacterium]